MSVSTAPLGEIAEINPRFDRDAFKGLTELASFVPMAWVSEESGAITQEEFRPVSELLRGFTPFDDRDVLVAKITPCFENGKIAHARISKRTGFGSTEFHVLRPHAARLNDRYLFHFLRLPRIRVQGEMRMTGSGGQRRVPKAFLEELLVPLPALPEQRRIAAILDKADALRAKRRQAIAKLDLLLQSVFLEMFGDPVTNPKGWPMVHVGDAFSAFVGGKNVECPDSGSSPYRILKVSAVTKTVFMPDQSKLAPDGLIPASEHIVRNGDLLFSRANTAELVAATAYVWETPPNLVLPDKIWRMVLRDESKLIPLFAWELFKNRAFRDELSKRSSGTSGSMKNISKAKLMLVPMPLPPLELQNKLALLSRRLHQQRAWLERQQSGLDQVQTAIATSAFAS